MFLNYGAIMALNMQKAGEDVSFYCFLPPFFLFLRIYIQNDTYDTMHCNKMGTFFHPMQEVSAILQTKSVTW